MRMRYRLKIFLMILMTSLPLVATYFEGDEHWAWLSRLLFAILITLGLIGGIVAFIKYGIKGERVQYPSWWPKWLLWLNSLVQDTKYTRRHK